MSSRELTKKELLKTTPLFDLIRGRGLTGSMAWRVQIKASGLPKEIQACLLAVVKRTRLWRVEKTGIAVELIAHFQDGVEAGVSCEKLISDFGEGRAVAKMIRRAKIRQRGIVYHGFRNLILLFCILVFTYIGLAYYYASGEPRVKIDYFAKINAITAGVPEDERAWPIYQEAMVAIATDNLNGDFKDILEGPLYGAKPGRVKWDRVVEYLKLHDIDLNRLREATEYEKLGCMMYQKKGASLKEHLMINSFTPALGVLRSAGEVLATDMYLAWDEKDGDRVIENFKAILNISRHLSEHSLMVNSDFCLYIKDLGVKHFSTVLYDAPELFTNKMLVKVAHILAEHRSRQLFDFSGERRSVYDMIQRVYTDDGVGDGHLSYRGGGSLIDINDVYHRGTKSSFVHDLKYEGVLGFLLIPAVTEYTASRKELNRVYDNAVDKMLKRFDVRLCDDSGELNPWDELEKELGTSIADSPYWPLSMFAIDINGMRHKIERSEAFSEGLLLGIGFELYHRDNRTYPESLKPLVYRYLPQLPVDRMTGGVLKYKLLAGKPIVYSVGGDGDDDGGVTPYDGCPSCPYPDISGVSSWPKTVVGSGNFAEVVNGDWVIWPLSNPPKLGSIP